MRRILVDNIVPGMKLARSLFSADGNTLLAAGAELREKYIQRLKELDVSFIYIEDNLTDDIEVEDVISQQARIEATRTVKEMFENSKVGKQVNLSKAKNVVNNVVDELVRNRSILVSFMDMRSTKDYLFAHSVNVCILSVMTGISLEYDELKLRDLGVGAILHDIGKQKIPEEIINKKGKLTPEEFTEVKKHPHLGFETLRNTDGINLLSAHCAFQHHERWDGSGYPRGLKGSEIHEFAQIVAIADVYDALISDVVYRRAIPVCEALAIIEKAGSTYFNQYLIEKFAENIAVYPIGTVVRLNTRELAVVVDVNKNNKLKPIVRIVFDENRQQVTRVIEVDMVKKPDLYIIEIVETLF